MKIKAKQWVKYQGEWHRAGDVFKIFKGDADEMKQYGEVIEEDEPEETDDEETVQEEPVRKGRRRKTEE